MENGAMELQELVNKAYRQMEIKKGTYLFREGEQAEEVYYIQSGKIQVSKIAADGQELSLRICSKGDVVGELILFCEDARYLLNAKVIEDGIVACIKREVLEKSLLENSKLALEFMKWMSDHFRKTQTKFRDLVLHGKKGALYSTLIRMCNSYGVMKEDGIFINLHLTNQDLANFCGTSREVVNRLLNDLRKQEIISIKNGKIKVLNLAYLRTVVEQF